MTLTDDEIKAAAIPTLTAWYISGDEHPEVFMQTYIDFARAVIAAHDERLRQQEPVAYGMQNVRDGGFADTIAPTSWTTHELILERFKNEPWVKNGLNKIMPLYAAPMPKPTVSQQEAFCEWKPMDNSDDYGSFETSCGRAWSFIEGGIKDNDVNFCHGCGKAILARPDGEKK